MEVLDERWTLLVVRELLLGSRHFNELRRGNPKMSPALLSKRLRRLERAGVVRRRVVGGRSTYELTESGLELRGIVDALGALGRPLGRRAGRGGPGPAPADVGRQAHHPGGGLAAGPHRGRHPVRGRRAAGLALVGLRRGDEVDICDVDPGFDVTATVRTSLRAMTEIWRGDRAWGDALRAGRVEVEAPREVARAVPGWIGQSLLAAVPRPA